MPGAQLSWRGAFAERPRYLLSNPGCTHSKGSCIFHGHHKADSHSHLRHSFHQWDQLVLNISVPSSPLYTKHGVKILSAKKKKSKIYGNLSRIWINTRKSNKQERKNMKKPTNKKGIKEKCKLQSFFFFFQVYASHKRFPWYCMAAVLNCHALQSCFSSFPNKGFRILPIPH